LCKATAKTEEEKPEVWGLRALELSPGGGRARVGVPRGTSKFRRKQ